MPTKPSPDQNLKVRDLKVLADATSAAIREEVEDLRADMRHADSRIEKRAVSEATEAAQELLKASTPGLLAAEQRALTMHEDAIASVNRYYDEVAGPMLDRVNNLLVRTTRAYAYLHADRESATRLIARDLPAYDDQPPRRGLLACIAHAFREVMRDPLARLADCTLAARKHGHKPPVADSWEIPPSSYQLFNVAQRACDDLIDASSTIALLKDDSIPEDARLLKRLREERDAAMVKLRKIGATSEACFALGAECIRRAERGSLPVGSDLPAVEPLVRCFDDQKDHAVETLEKAFIRVIKEHRHAV